MDLTVEHDALGTHFDWQLDGVTPRMIDWFWSNMEKGFVLWHPEQHESLEWPVPPRHGDPLGAVHNAPQQRHRPAQAGGRGGGPGLGGARRRGDRQLGGLPAHALPAVAGGARGTAQPVRRPGRQGNRARGAVPVDLAMMGTGSHRPVMLTARCRTGADGT